VLIASDVRDVSVETVVKDGLVVARDGRLVVDGNRVAAEVPLPTCGVTSDRSLEDVAQGMTMLEDTVKALRCPLSAPFLTLQRLGFTGLPFLRLTDRGIVDIRNRSFVDLFVS
jgi:adenine deaminase